MAKINPYLMFNGNAAEAFTFYKSVFGGEFAALVRFKDMPGDPNNPIPESDADKVMHVALPIGGNVLMASDISESRMGAKKESDNRYSVSISAASVEEADKLFHGLSAGGKVEVPIAHSPWGSYFGMFADKFGIQWMVDFDARTAGQH